MLHNKIYALCDFDLITKYNLSISQYIQHISQYDIVYIQYRDKINPLLIQEKNLKLLKKYTQIPIIINDNIELLNIADGLHLGQEDLKKLQNDTLHIKEKSLVFKFLRKLYPRKIFGLSTHNEFEILEANNFDIDYVGLGAYRATNTKDISNILGDNISYLAKMSKFPVGAIGGVQIDDYIKNITYNVIGSGLLR